MICEFFGDIIIRKEDVECFQEVVPGDVLSMQFDEPSYVIVVCPGKTIEGKGEE